MMAKRFVFLLCLLLVLMFSQTSKVEASVCEYDDPVLCVERHRPWKPTPAPTPALSSVPTPNPVPVSTPEPPDRPTRSPSDYRTPTAPDGYQPPAPGSQASIPAKVNAWHAATRWDTGYCPLVGGAGGISTWPLPGYQVSPGRHFRETSNHRGVDITAPLGTSVLAAGSGTVVWAGRNMFGWGFAVALSHGGYVTVYAHLGTIAVNCGQYVGAGQVIGTVGLSGLATWPHLHFEVRIGDREDVAQGINHDPLLFIRG